MRKHRRHGSRSQHGVSEAAARTPGKRTLTGLLQLKRSPAAPADKERRATAGIAGTGGPLPHLDAIQNSFGRHDIRGVTAHVDSTADGACRDLGAEAFALGDHVAFAGAPSLHTAAHEAAHVVQQRAGVHLSGGVGKADDEHERHADAVADRVVRGESSEALLDRYAPGAPARALQRKIGFEFETDFTVTVDREPLEKKDPIGNADYDGFKIESDDDGRMEFVIYPPLPIDHTLFGRLETIFKQIEGFCGKLEAAAKRTRTARPQTPQSPKEKDEFIEDDGLQVEESGSASGSDDDSGSDLDIDETEYDYHEFPLSEVTDDGHDGEYFVMPRQAEVAAHPQITLGMSLDQIAELPLHNKDKPLPGLVGQGITSSPGTFVPRVTPEALQAVGINLADIGGEISREMKGLLTLVASYLCAGTHTPFDYPKIIADSFLLARTDFATLFLQMPEWDYFDQDGNREKWVALAMRVAQLPDDSVPVYVNGIRQEHSMVATPFGPTRRAWLLGMVKGEDLMSSAKDPAYESMGEFGDKTERVATDKGEAGPSAGIFEMRVGQTGTVGYKEWKLFARQAAAFALDMQVDPFELTKE